MFQDHLSDFSESLESYLMGDTDSDTIDVLLKRHDQNLVQLGDFSFPNSAFLSYQESGPGRGEESRSQHINLAELFAEKKNEIVKVSRNWILPVADVIEFEGRSYVYLQRACAFRVGMTEILYNMDLFMNKLLTGNTLCMAKFTVNDSGHVLIESFIKDQSDLTSKRAMVLWLVIQNLSLLFDVKCPILITSDATTKSPTHKVICVGPVINAETGEQEQDLLEEDYVYIREEEIKEVALSRYGDVFYTQPNSSDIVQIGESATTFELLQRNPTEPTSINFTNNSFESGGALYILYSCARVETILEEFGSRVRGGLYPPLPDHKEINLSVLEGEDEWSLMFNFVMGLNAALSKCVEFNTGEQELVFRPHYVCKFITAMMRVFDAYYSTTNILLIDPAPDMLPQMYARIHLLKALSLSFQICLRILHIEPVKPWPQ